MADIPQNQGTWRTLESLQAAQWVGEHPFQGAQVLSPLGQLHCFLLPAAALLVSGSFRQLSLSGSLCSLEVFIVYSWEGGAKCI